MNRYFHILLLLIIGCSEPKQVDLNPYNPNIGITVIELEKSGWKLTTADDGVCVYKNLDVRPKLVFYMEMQDDCKTVVSQELYIDLYPKGEDKPQPRNTAFEITDELNKHIDSILITYNSRRISNFDRSGPCSLEFIGENDEKKKLEWDINNL